MYSVYIELFIYVSGGPLFRMVIFVCIVCKYNEEIHLGSRGKAPTFFMASFCEKPLLVLALLLRQAVQLVASAH